MARKAAFQRNTDLQKCEAKLNAANEEIANMKHLVEMSEVSIKENEKEIEKLKNQLESAGLHVQMGEVGMEECGKRIEFLEAEVKSSTAATIAIKEQLMDEKNKNQMISATGNAHKQDMEKKLQVIMATINTLKEKHGGELEAAERELIELRRTRVELSQDLEVAETHLRDLKAAHASELNESNLKLQDVYESRLEHSEKNLQEVRAERIAEAAACSEKMLKMKTSHAVEIDTLKSELSGLQMRQKEMDTELSSKEEFTKSLIEKNKSVSEALEKSVASKNELIAELSRFENANKENERELRDSLNALQEKKEQLQTLQANFDSAVAKKDGEISTLTRENKETHNQLNTSFEQHSAHTVTIANLENKLEENQRTQREKNEKISFYKAEMARAEGVIAEFQEWSANAQVEVTTRENRISELEEDVREKGAALSALRTQMQEADKTISSLKATVELQEMAAVELEESKSDLTKSREKVESLQSEIDRIEESNSAVVEELASSLEREKRKQRQSLDQFEASNAFNLELVSDWKNRYEDLLKQKESETSALKAAETFKSEKQEEEINRMEGVIAEFQEWSANAQVEVTTRENRISELEEDVREKGAALSALRTQMQEADKTISSLKATVELQEMAAVELEESKSDLTKSREKVESLQSEIDRIEERIVELRSSSEASLKEIGFNEETIAALSTEVRSKETTIDSLTAKVEELRSALELTNSKQRQSLDQIDSITASSRDFADEWKQRYDFIVIEKENEISALKMKLAESERSKHSSDAVIEEFQQWSTNAQLENEQSVAAIENLNESVVLSAAENEELSEQLAKAEATINEFQEWTAKAQEELESSESTIAALKSEVMELKKHRPGAIAEVDLGSSVAVNISLQEELQRQLASAESKIVEFQEWSASAQIEMQKKEETIAELSSKIGKLEKMAATDSPIRDSPLFTNKKSAQNDDNKQLLNTNTMAKSTKVKSKDTPRLLIKAVAQSNAMNISQDEAQELSIACEALVAEREMLLGETIDLLESCKAECEANTREQVSRVKDDAMRVAIGLKNSFERREMQRIVCLGSHFVTFSRLKLGFVKWKTKAGASARAVQCND